MATFRQYVEILTSADAEEDNEDRDLQLAIENSLKDGVQIDTKNVNSCKFNLKYRWLKLVLWLGR